MKWFNVPLAFILVFVGIAVAGCNYSTSCDKGMIKVGDSCVYQ